MAGTFWPVLVYGGPKVSRLSPTADEIETWDVEARRWVPDPTLTFLDLRRPDSKPITDRERSDLGMSMRDAEGWASEYDF